VFTEADFATFMHNDEQLRRAAHARWMLLCEREPTSKSADATSCAEAKGIYLSDSPAVVGSSEGAALLVADSTAAGQHAQVGTRQAGRRAGMYGSWVEGTEMGMGWGDRGFA
jgi:hypothetical protein